MNYRTIEVRYYCVDKLRNFVSDVRESSICNYTIDVNLADLCTVPIFHQKGIINESITCTSIDE